MTRFIFALLLLCFVACGDDDKDGTATNCTSTVDQAQVLERYSELIRARTTSTLATVDNLVAKAEFYVNNPTEAALDDLKFSLSVANQEWLRTEPYSYGPDGSMQVILEVNPFPVDEAAVDALVQAGSFDGSTPANFDRGFPALDYLLFNGNTTEVHQRLQASSGAAQVVLEISSALRDQTASLAAAWEQNAAAFVANTGTSAGSGISVLINAFSKHFEDTRRDRLGTPFGVTTLGFPNPQTVEAPYSTESLRFLRISIEASQAAFLGTDALVGASNLPSLADYLSGLPTADAAALVDDIERQYTAMLSTLEEVDAPLAEAVEQDTDDVQQAYNAISRQVVNLKTDVPSVACVAITYVDNPSDSD